MVTFKYILKAARRVRKFRSLTHERREGGQFKPKDIHTICLFVGQGRSGTSLIGYLLNQHPNIAIAHEYYLLKHINANNVDHHLQRMFYEVQKTKYADFISLGEYSFHKLRPEQFVNQPIQVLGDKAAGNNARVIGKRENVLQIIEGAQKIVKFIFVIRNPYDIISTISLRGVFGRSPLYQEGCSITQVADRLGASTQSRAQLSEELPIVTKILFGKMRVVQELTERYGEALIPIYYHEFAAEPCRELRKLLKFLNVEEPTGYLDEAAKQVRPATQSRELINYVWSDSARAEVAEQMRHFNFFADYSFESD